MNQNDLLCEIQHRNGNRMFQKLRTKIGSNLKLKRESTKVFISAATNDGIRKFFHQAN